jgi:putative intracellular protease/amidase
MPKALIVMTSHGQLGNTGRPTGLWLEELAVPYYALDAEAEMTLASIAGGEVPLDPQSIRGTGDIPSEVQRFLDDANAMMALKTTPSLKQLDATAYDAIFLPGGHGTMWDFPGDAPLAAAISRAHDAGSVIAAVCHGVAGLVSATRGDDRPFVEGKRISSFTDAEEEAAGLTSVVPFLLETRLRKLGALIEKAPNFQPFAVRDGRLITGQNPASANQVVQLILQALNEQPPLSR